MYADPLITCDPQSYAYNMFILNTNASFGDGEFKINEVHFDRFVSRIL